MNDEFLALFEAAKALVTYIDNESVFDRAAAGGCSGMDFHLSDTFYDLIVNTRNAINDVETELKICTTPRICQTEEGFGSWTSCLKLNA